MLPPVTGWPWRYGPGALTADLEFVQFHPTALHLGTGSRGRQPLITEAIRGEGAVLLDTAGRPGDDRRASAR